MISRTVLVAVEPFGERCSAARAAAAIGRGLSAGNPGLTVDVCPLEGSRGEGEEHGGGEGEEHGGGDDEKRDRSEGKKHGGERPEEVGRLLGAVHFDARMRAARAVVLGAERLDEHTLLGSVTFEAATRARQAGVPAYAVTAENQLSLFDARMLDLQVVLRARRPRELAAAGMRLATVILA